MHSFMNLSRAGYSDFSSELRDKEDWNIGSLMAFEHHFDVVAFAVDPVTSLLAVGTIGGFIRIFGAPGVEATLVLSGSTPVKFLRFAPNLLKLLCVDENDRLYLWDLTSFGQIKLEVTTRFDRPVISLAVSPSHTHAFIALETGVVKTYDLLCRRISPYSIPSAWQLYEEKMLSDGLTTSSDPSARIPVDVVIHPRNLDLVFVVYGGGVVLIDLKERNTVRVYELLVPAGAPGGAGYLAPDLLSHRRPAATSFAVHPSGHFFVVGYTDGCIAFWALEDEDRPLLVRTLDDLDVNVVDGDKLEEYLPDGSHTQKSDKIPFNPREPIFKLAWSGYPNSSDPRCGPTSLVVLGGQFSGDPSGINVLWLRAFNPPAPPAAVPPLNEGLHPHFRIAMRDSLELLDAHFYETCGLTQDFLLVPRASPHFDGTWDPKAILLLFEAEEHTRAIKAFQFPPPVFSAEPPLTSPNSTTTKVEGSSTDSLTQDLASTLQSMTTFDDPKELLLPSALWSGPDAVLHAMLVSVDRTAYEQLIKGAEDWLDDFKMGGGIAAPDEEILNDIKFAKVEQQASIQEFETIASPLSKGIFVLEARGGLPCRADRARLALALEHESDANPIKRAARRSRSGSSGSKGSSVEVEDSGPKCFLVVAGAKGVRCFEDLGDGKAARTDWPSKAGLVTAVQVIERNGSCALAAFTDKHEAITYSLPVLEYMHTLEFASNSSLPVSPDATGDFLTITPLLNRTSASASIYSDSSKQSSLLPPSSPIHRMHLLTLFDIRRGYHTPLVSLVEHQDGSTVDAVPAQPQPVSMAPAGLLTWLGGLVGQGAVRGDEIDALLAGPDRPIPERNPAREAAQGNKFVEWEDNKAGEMLDELSDRFDSLEEGSKSMVSQAKRLATQQTAKSWLPW
ncbi:hypothetical protein EWM64_g2007 [Hericium alpestre]|uniref:Lethal giant larvae (Lgl)-like C-terminal domain-containing protein n=1 Tax=Hericium alpestre TaxID=135208 RepID=A0A4Z0A5J9_9AGAM|nr:hypothetical protein EWM64_g2007 [Hericium alpestre]